MSLRRVGLTIAVVTVVGFVMVGMHATLAPSPRASFEAFAQTEGKFTGASSCSSSKCHGDTKPRTDYPKLNESLVWAAKDKHAKAYEALTNETLKSGFSPSKIASNLKIEKPEASDRCLTCHALNAKPALRGMRFDITRGVYCEVCHGPGQNWLESHAEKGATHADSVKLGMYDTKNMLLRAEKCVSCHLKIDAEMVAAGHPDLLAFELDTFSSNMPAHWRDKGPFAPTKVWATGQVVALREAAKQLGDRATANAPGPELTDGLEKVQGHAAVVTILLAATAPDAQKAVEADLAALRDAVGKDDKARITSITKNLQATMNAQAPKVATREFDAAGTKKILSDVSSRADSIAAVGIRAAQQAGMAMDRLYGAYSRSPARGADPAATKALDAVFASIKDPKKFDAAGFSAAAKSFGQALK